MTSQQLLEVIGQLKLIDGILADAQSELKSLIDKLEQLWRESATDS